jgi:hypothetical protein
MRNILRFIVCIIPREAIEKTIAPAERLPVAPLAVGSTQIESIFIASDRYREAGFAEEI